MKHCRRFGTLVMKLLRELADEDAYGRHLKFHGREHSPAEWRRFSDERFRRKSIQPKCC